VGIFRETGKVKLTKKTKTRIMVEKSANKEIGLGRNEIKNE
jgi:hypothetical protein